MSQCEALIVRTYSPSSRLVVREDNSSLEVGCGRAALDEIAGLDVVCNLYALAAGVPVTEHHLAADLADGGGKECLVHSMSACDTSNLTSLVDG